MDCEHPAHTEEIKAKTVLPTSAEEVQSISTHQLCVLTASSLGMGTVQPVTAVPHHHCGTVAQLLALLPHSKKVMGSIPAWGAVGSGGQVLPRVHSAQVGYLPGLSVWSLHVLPVFTRGFLH